MRCTAYRLLISLLLLGAVGINSCKTKDELAPNIEVHFPSAGANYQVPDTVHVGLSITDETDLTNVEVKLIGPNNILASSVASIDPDGNIYDGTLNVVMLDKYLPSGDYAIHIRARDGTNERFKFIEVNVQELPKLRRGIFALVDGGATSSVFKVDSLGAAMALATLNQDAGHLCVDNRNDHCIVTGRTTGEILAMQTNTGHEVWSNTGFEQPPQPIYLDLICDDGDAYISMYEHEIRGLNGNGVLIMNQPLNSAFRPGELFATDDQLLVEQNEVGSNGNWIYRYFKDNGVEQNLLEIPMDIVAICPFDEERVMLFGNDESGQARVLVFYIFDNYTWEPRDLPAGEVRGAVATANGRYAIVHSTGLFTYTYDPNFLGTLQSNSTFEKVRYDEDRGLILVSDGTLIKEFSLSGSFQGAHSFPGTVADFDIHYTK